MLPLADECRRLNNTPSSEFLTIFMLDQIKTTMRDYHVMLGLCLLFVVNQAQGQCTPVDCLSSLPPYGGICETEIADGLVNEEYYDFISFHITDNCVDGALLGEDFAGTSYKVKTLHSFEVANLPNGLDAATNQATYTAPANGCAALFGTPTEAGVFSVSVSFMINVDFWAFSSSCGGFLPPLAQNDNLIETELDFLVLPDASFEGVAEGSVFCANDADVSLVPSGTLGGEFIGEGVVGNIFSPSLVGPGVYTITYTVNAQEGTAVAPASNSSTVTVTVLEDAVVYYADNDGDGFGDPNNTLLTCVDPGEAWVSNGEDCDDDNPFVYPGAPPTGTGVDNNCDGIIDEFEAESCSGDFNGDYIVNAEDLMIFLSQFGCTSNCLCDLNADGVVNGDDLLIFLSVYSTVCQVD